jgi:hypothetical protein
MFQRVHLLSAGIAFALTLAAVSANATTYDFSSLPQGTTVTPLTLNGATFTASNDPGGFTVGANGGVWSTLGSSVLSSAGVAATLNIAFSTAQTGISFDAGTGDFAGFNTNDSVTVSEFNGTTLVGSQSIVPTYQNGDLFPSGFFSLAAGAAFNSVTIAAADSAGSESFAIAELATTPVPLPAAIWMLLSGLGGAIGLTRRRVRNAAV